MANENRYFKTPFAESGDRVEVPDASVGGAVGFDTGFGSDYELPQGSVNKKRIERDKYNGLHHSITKNLKQWQEHLYPTWIEDAGAGTPFSYPVGMIVNHAGKNWVSNDATNTEEPGVGIKWSVHFDDWMAFTAALYADAGITPNGLPDTAIASQRLDAINVLATSRSVNTNLIGTLLAEAGSVVTASTRYVYDPLVGKAYNLPDNVGIGEVVSSVTSTNIVTNIRSYPIASVSGEGVTQTFTVGTGGNFLTINAGIDFLYRNFGRYRTQNGGVTPTKILKLLSGFVMSEQVWYESCDLSFIEMTSEDAEVVIQRSALTRSVGTAVLRYMAFTFRNTCISPKISVLFNMDTSGVATGRGGCRVEANSFSYWNSGAGVKNAAERGLHLVNAAAWANTTIWSGAGQRGIRVGDNSRIWAENADCTYAGESGIACDTASLAMIRRINVSNSAGIGVLALRCALLDAFEMIANDCAGNGFETEACNSIIEGAEILRSGGNGVRASEGASVSAKLSNISNSTGANVRLLNNSKGDFHSSIIKDSLSINFEANGASEADIDSCDLTGAGTIGLLMQQASTANGRLLNASNAGSIGVSVSSGSRLNADNATINDCLGNGMSVSASNVSARSIQILRSGGDGINATELANVSCPLGNVSNSVGDNIECSYGAKVDIHAGTATGAGINNLYAFNGGEIIADSVVATGAAARGASANGGNINIRLANISGSGGAADLLVQNGAIVRFNGGTGASSAVNTLTAAGIIFK